MTETYADTTHGPMSAPRLTAYYIAALMLIGCITLGSHMLALVSLRQEKGLAATINLSGRQRMLSQRIAGLAAQYRLGDATARDAMAQSLNEMETEHASLSNAYLRIARDENDRQLSAAYFGGSNSLDSRIRHFIATGRQVANLPTTDPRQPALTASLFAEARAPLLNDLNRVVSMYQHEAEGRTTDLHRLQWMLLAVMLATLCLEARFLFQPMVRRIVEATALLLDLTVKDSLTGIFNRRGFQQQAQVEFLRARRYNHPMCVMIVDADRFKSINDTYGHAAGDAVLKALSASLCQSTRPADVVGRVGGEEFCILMPVTTIAGAALMAERLRHAIEAMEVSHRGQMLRVTISAGVAEVSLKSPSIEAALSLADHRLYRAKHEGRNRVVSEGSEQPTQRQAAGETVPIPIPATS